MGGESESLPATFIPDFLADADHTSVSIDPLSVEAERRSIR